MTLVITMNGKIYEIREQQQKFNTAVAASDSEVVITGTLGCDSYNHLEVLNSDAVGIQIRLDNDSNRAYNINAQTGFILDVAEGQSFKQVMNVNLDTVTAQTVDKILFKAFKKVEV